MNRLGILFHNKKRHPVNVAVAMALGEFRRVHETAGHPPREARFNPAQRPEEHTIAQLMVIVDTTVPLNHIRIWTDEIKELEAA